MSLQRTLSIIKPDAVKRHLIGAILARFEQQGFNSNYSLVFYE